MGKSRNVKYWDDEKIILKTHHIKGKMIEKIRKGYASIYDIKVSDVYKHCRHYLEKAQEENLYVVLEVIS